MSRVFDRSSKGVYVPEGMRDFAQYWDSLRIIGTEHSVDYPEVLTIHLLTCFGCWATDCVFDDEGDSRSANSERERQY